MDAEGKRVVELVCRKVSRKAIGTRTGVAFAPFADLRSSELVFPTLPIGRERKGMRFGASESLEAANSEATKRLGSLVEPFALRGCFGFGGETKFTE
jgi:hypothetical protein